MTVFAEQLRKLFYHVHSEMLCNENHQMKCVLETKTIVTVSLSLMPKSTQNTFVILKIHTWSSPF